MKKYIFIILSFGLFLMPLGALAQVTAEECASYPGDSCPNGCFNNRGSAEEYCDICPETQYSNNGLYCSTCTKPNGAEFLTSYDNEYAGMSGPYECPWEITCPENKEISPSNWNNSTTCSNCSTGYYKPANQTQYWDGTTMTGDCQAKNFIINPKLIIPKSSGNITVEPIQNCITYTYNNNQTISTTNEFKDNIFNCVDAYIKNKYNFPTGNQSFGLKYSDGRDTGYNVKYDDSNFVFTTDVRNIGANNPNDTTFTMEITMVPKKYNICYCSKKPDSIHVSSLSNICQCRNAEFGTTQTASSMTSQIYTIFKKDCNGQYLSQWNGHLYYLPSSGYLTYTRTFDTPVDVNAQINEPENSNQYIILTPIYTSCSAGTYSNNPICPTSCTQCSAGQYSKDGAFNCLSCPAGTSSGKGASECTPCNSGEFSAAGSASCSTCPDGFISASGATTQTDCYINTTMKFKDKNNKSVTILSSPVYYEE